MFSKPYESERLIIRDISVADAQRVYDLWRNPENDKYMCDPIGSVDEILAICHDKANDADYLKVATLKETGEIIGTCCFGPTAKSIEWGFGYSIDKNYWGQGFATEIVQAIITYGQSLGITDYISECAEENTASARVMEKCGMHFDSKSSFLQPQLNIVYPALIYKLQLA